MAEPNLQLTASVPISLFVLYVILSLTSVQSEARPAPVPGDVDTGTSLRSRPSAEGRSSGRRKSEYPYVYGNEADGGGQLTTGSVQMSSGADRVIDSRSVGVKEDYLDVLRTRDERRFHSFAREEGDLRFADQGSVIDPGGTAEAPAEGNLLLLALPVGQGDSTVIVCPEHDGNVVLFDMGSTDQDWAPGRVAQFLEEETANGDRSLMSRLTTVVVSHPHTDHYNYLPEVFPTSKQGLKAEPSGSENLVVAQPKVSTKPSHPDFAAALRVFVAGKVEDYKYNAMEAWLGEMDTQLFNGGESCFMEDCHTGNTWSEQLCGENSPVMFQVLSANLAGGGSNRNEDSVVLKIRHGDNSALLVGDFEGGAQDKLIAHINDVAPGLLLSDVYKVSHHGASNLANFPNFLNAVGARWAFVSSAHAAVSQYGHPKCATIDRLLAEGTLYPAPVHTVDCTDSQRNVEHRSLAHGIYATAPTEAQRCVVEVRLPPSSIVPVPLLRCA